MSILTYVFLNVCVKACVEIRNGSLLNGYEPPIGGRKKEGRRTKGKTGEGMKEGKGNEGGGGRREEGGRRNKRNDRG